MKLKHSLRKHSTIMARKGKAKHHLSGEDNIENDAKVIVIEDSLDSVIDVDLLYAQQETFYGDLRCAKCGKIFESAEEMAHHNQVKGCIVIESICHICMNVVEGHENFLKHVKNHEFEEAEDAVDYDDGSEAKKEERSNVKGGAEMIDLQCPFCGEGIGYDGIDFEKHLHKHTFPDATGRRYPCIVCDKPFKTRSDLRRHIVRHTNIKPFKCIDCVKKFVTKSELQTHHRSHTGEHPYECDLCPATFTTSSSMKKHRNKHTGETRYICYICSKKYFDSYALNRHIMMHTGERPYRCKVCNRGFCQRADITVHMRTHTNERPFKCPVCFLSFKQSSNRNAHVRRHDAEVQ